jgi:hypothetical protein
MKWILITIGEDNKPTQTFNKEYKPTGKIF